MSFIMEGPISPDDLVPFFERQFIDKNGAVNKNDKFTYDALACISVAILLNILSLGRIIYYYVSNNFSQ